MRRPYRLPTLALAACALPAIAVALAASPASAQKIENPVAVFSGLDKITGRIIRFEAGIDETVQFGALQLTARVCYTRPPTESPNTTSFIEVDELSLDGALARIFTGWIYANSPGLSAIEHPVYDIWLVDCLPAPAAEIAEEDRGPDRAGTIADHPLPPPRPAL
ncbi:DUF2155 domain-containing protein [Salinarimonas sp. NSM]|uniref:DUF2155 domain-containing protein n=1 Tax=Salinarimonas sp. NSM TaxID=3458003 RepID=UPI004035A331